MSNPFNDRLDWALCGKYVEVATDEYLIRGWVEIVHHQRGSLVMHDCKRRLHPKHVEDGDQPASILNEDDWQEVGSVFLRTANTVTALKAEQSKDIQFISPEVTVPFDGYTMDFEPKDYHMRMAYRNGYTGGFPVVRPLEKDHELYDTNDRYQILNGHKRIEAARRVGLTMHPMEVVRCTDEEAEELFQMAHRDQDTGSNSRDSVDWESLYPAVRFADDEEDGDDDS